MLYTSVYFWNTRAGILCLRLKGGSLSTPMKHFQGSRDYLYNEGEGQVVSRRGTLSQLSSDYQTSARDLERTRLGIGYIHIRDKQTENQKESHVYKGSRSHLKDIFHFERNFNNVIK